MVIKLTEQNPFLPLSPVASMLQADETSAWFEANLPALHIARGSLVF